MQIKKLATIRCLTQEPEFLLRLNRFTPLLYFTTTSNNHKNSNQLPPRPTVPDHEIKHVYLKGSGPGGQKINKTSSAVQLTHLPTGLVVKSQATRSQSQNHTIARRILAEKIELLEKGTESRAAKKIERDSKRKRSSAKKSRRKYRKLEEEKLEGGSTGTFGALGAAATTAAASESQSSSGVWVDEEDDGTDSEQDVDDYEEEQPTNEK